MEDFLDGEDFIPPNVDSQTGEVLDSGAGNISPDDVLPASFDDDMPPYPRVDFMDTSHNDSGTSGSEVFNTLEDFKNHKLDRQAKFLNTARLNTPFPAPRSVPKELALSWADMPVDLRAQASSKIASYVVETLFPYVIDLVLAYDLRDTTIDGNWYRSAGIVREIMAWYQYDRAMFKKEAAPTSPQDYHYWFKVFQDRLASRTNVFKANSDYNVAVWLTSSKTGLITKNRWIKTVYDKWETFWEEVQTKISVLLEQKNFEAARSEKEDGVEENGESEYRDNQEDRGGENNDSV